MKIRLWAETYSKRLKMYSRRLSVQVYFVQIQVETYQSLLPGMRFLFQYQLLTLPRANLKIICYRGRSLASVECLEIKFRGKVTVGSWKYNKSNLVSNLH